jgi:hypothetical protein
MFHKKLIRQAVHHVFFFAFFGTAEVGIKVIWGAVARAVGLSRN